MSRSPDYKLGYSRGYNAGSSGSSWPKHIPMVPPDGVLKVFFSAAEKLADEADAWQATLEEDDDGLTGLRSSLEAFYEAREVVALWINRAASENLP